MSFRSEKRNQSQHRPSASLVRTLMAFCLVMLSGTARADFEADFTTSSTQARTPKFHGKVYLKGDRLRVDSSYPFDLNAYAKAGAKTASVAVPSFHIRLSANLEKYSGQIPLCLAKDFAACVSDLKLKKIGSEKCGDQNCEIYESLSIGKEIKKLKVWQPENVKEISLVKSLLTKSNGVQLTTTFKKITGTVHPENFYDVPAGFVNAGSIESFYGDLKGKSE
ncbi:MAG: hypothetical protein H7301_02940 [Cryobacterium sp.]|nr:hypothetical protein [Oligoflexia bacterium]